MNFSPKQDFFRDSKYIIPKPSAVEEMKKLRTNELTYQVFLNVSSNTLQLGNKGLTGYEEINSDGRQVEHASPERNGETEFKS